MRSVPPALAAAFEGKLTITAPELCRLIPLDPETLRGHIRRGHISYAQLGFGEKAPRRVFTLENVVAFLDGQGRTEQLPESRPGRHRTAGKISKAEEEFLAEVAALTAAKPKAGATGFLARRAQRIARERAVAATAAEPGARKGAPRP